MSMLREESKVLCHTKCTKIMLSLENYIFVLTLNELSSLRRIYTKVSFNSVRLHYTLCNTKLISL